MAIEPWSKVKWSFRKMSSTLRTTKTILEQNLSWKILIFKIGNHGMPDWQIGVIAGCVIVVVAVLIAGAVVVHRRRKAKKAEEKKIVEEKEKKIGDHEVVEAV